MISVEQALGHLFSLVAPLGSEDVPLAQAAGRVLAEDAVATRDQPPFSASAMDGYAVRADEVAVGAKFDVIGESAAGHGFDGTCAPGQAVRIFTGAPLPDGASHVVIQEDVERTGDRITLTDRLGGAIISAPRAAISAQVTGSGRRACCARRISPCWHR